MNLGKFYVFEGIDGTGKSSTLKELKEYTKEIWYTQEPYSKVYYEMIKRSNDPWVKAYFFAMDRYEHIRDVIEPELDMGDVVCDRYVYSNYVYQISEGCDYEWLKSMQPDNLIKPDKIFYFVADEVDIIKRMSKRGEIPLTKHQINRLDQLYHLVLFDVPTQVVNTSLFEKDDVVDYVLKGLKI